MTITDLILPKRGIILPEVPSYIKLDMAFGAGNATILGDKSRYHSHGTIHGATVADGLHGKCLDFDSTIPSYVEIPASHTQLDFQAEDFSLIAGVYIDDLTSHRHLFQRGLAEVDGYYSYINKNGAFYTLTNQLGSLQLSASTPGGITTGAWFTLGCSRNGASIRIYVNGIDDTSTLMAHIDPATCVRSAKIGVHDNKVSNPFDGKIEFLRVFGGVALSASEHLAYHNALA